MHSLGLMSYLGSPLHLMTNNWVIFSKLFLNYLLNNWHGSVVTYGV